MNQITLTEEEGKQWNSILSDDMLEAVSHRFKLLAEPMRLRILRTLCDQERTVMEVVGLVNASQANVSKHLTLMHENGMVSRRKEGMKCYYKIVDESIIYTCYLTSKSLVANLQNRLNSAQKPGTQLPIQNV